MGVKHKIWSKKGNGELVEVNLTPMRAIRFLCLQCVTWSPSGAKDCVDQPCPLFPFRFGKDPSRRGIGGTFTSTTLLVNVAFALL